MTDSEKLDKLISDVARLDGRMGTLTAMHANTEKQVSKVEGRMWGILVAVGGAFGTAVLSLVMAKGGVHVAQAAHQLLVAISQ